jgi:hypothetical protein
VQLAYLQKYSEDRVVSAASWQFMAGAASCLLRGHPAMQIQNDEPAHAQAFSGKSVGLVSFGEASAPARSALRKAVFSS